MATTPKAYSYIRFSTPEQALGDSERRQVESARDYATAHGLELDESLTFADKGAVLFVNGERHAIPASRAREVEPTGAGDVFAAAFLVRYNTTGDPLEAATYAAVAGALTVEGSGIAGVPTAEELAGRWQASQPR